MPNVPRLPPLHKTDKVASSATKRRMKVNFQENSLSFNSERRKNSLNSLFKLPCKQNLFSLLSNFWDKEQTTLTHTDKDLNGKLPSCMRLSSTLQWASEWDNKKILQLLFLLAEWKFWHEKALRAKHSADAWKVPLKLFSHCSQMTINFTRKNCMLSQMLNFSFSSFRLWHDFSFKIY